MSSVFMRAGPAVLAAALLCVPALAPTRAAADPVLPPSGGVLYVTNAVSGDVSSMAIGPRGELTLMGPPVSTGGCTLERTGPGCTPRGIAVAPNGATVYVVNSDSSTLAVFRVGARGTLQPNPLILDTGKEPWGATLTADGRTLYVTETGDGTRNGTISAYHIGLDGTPGPRRAFDTNSDHPKQTVLSPDGRSLYLSYADAEETEESPQRVITRFAVLPDGSLEEPGQDVAKVGPASYGITISPDGGLVYATSNIAQNVWGFRVGKDGSLTPVPGLRPFVPDAVGLKVTPDGQHLYVCANFDTDAPLGGLYGFTIRADGSLTPTADSPVPSFGTSSVVITPDGRDAFANVQDKNLVHAFAIGSGGRLKEAPGSPFKTGGSHPLFQSLAIRPVPANTPQ